MMTSTTELSDNACIVEGVQPLLTELQEPVNPSLCLEHDEDRQPLEHFIHAIFHRAYDADVRAFYPNLLAYASGTRLRGVVGYRDGMVKPLFSEHYLDGPAEAVIGAHLNQPVTRQELVEVGNLALAGSGEARWAIAAVTTFLHAAGYRWVLFTAVRPLVNAFQRLGLNPIQIAAPDPRRLPPGGSNWGRYYEAGPVVCAGDIDAGYRKLRAHVSPRQPALHALLEESRRLGIASRYNPAQGAREAQR